MVKGIQLAAPSPALTFEIVQEWADVERFADQWDALWQGCPQARVGQGFTWTKACWNTVLAERDLTLFCLVGRLNGVVELVWPFTIERHAAWKVGRPLNSQTSEYTSILLRPSTGAALVRSALDYINGAKAADVWLFPDVRSDELLYEVLRRHPRARRQRAQIAPMVKAADVDSFALYRKRLGAHRCRELARLRRRLEEAGTLQFSRLTGGAAFSQGIDWLLSQKVAWLERANRKNNWLGSKPFATLLKATQAGEERGPSLFTLQLNGRLIACEYSHVDACRVEAFIGAYDPALGRFAPGQILQDECIGWSLCRGLDYDFRLGDEDYKTPSADAAVEATSFALLTSWLARFYDPAISTLRALKGWWGRFAEPH